MSESKEKPARILVIDDEENLRLSFETLLSRAGFGPVMGVSTFDDAVLAIESNDFELIVSDIVLEGSSGIDLLRRVKELGKKCPVVMITGYPNIDTAAEAVRLGAYDYLPKPVKKDDLLRVAKAALDHLARLLEKEQTDAEKEKNRYYQETILRSVREIIITVDPKLEVVDMNDKAKEWAKSNLPEVHVGTYLHDLRCSAGKALTEDAEKVLKIRETIRVHQVEWQRENDNRGILSVSATPLEDGQGIFLGVVLTAREVTHLESGAEHGEQQSGFHSFIGNCKSMQKVYALIKNVGKVDTTVLITGESGTGKELVAEALHAESPRRDRALVKVDCTAIPEDLLESELFGHKKGSFTGADQDRLGRILQADGGTLFLDEIGDISQRTQLRLLRFLQEKTFYPVGRDEPIQVDVRVVAATNADLKKKVRDDLFREDLYFRLRVVDVILPPVRERKEDVPQLATHFMIRFRNRMGKEIHGFSDQAISALTDYDWPGNVRELEHVVERACVLCKGNTITSDILPIEVQTDSKAPESLEPDTSSVQPDIANRHEPINESDRILYALRKTAGNKAKAARLLGIDRSTLYRKMHYYKIDLSTESEDNSLPPYSENPSPEKHSKKESSGKYNQFPSD